MNLDSIKKLREKTGLSIGECKKALEISGGDENKALEELKKGSKKGAEKKRDRITKEGSIFSYIHGTGRIGALVKIECETDFVSRNLEFQKFGKDLAMQIVAENPKDLASFLEGFFIKDSSKKIKELMNEKINQLGENIKVTDFSRFEV